MDLTPLWVLGFIPVWVLGTIDYRGKQPGDPRTDSVANAAQGVGVTEQATAG